MPAALVDLEKQLEHLLLRLDELQRARPDLPTAIARAQAGEAVDDLLTEISEIEEAIHELPAETLEDAAVKLRRLSAHIAPGAAARLLQGALQAVEREAGSNGIALGGPEGPQAGPSITV